MIDEAEKLILFEENDMGDAGRRIYESVLKLPLLCKLGPPDKPEFASVTNELAPTLGPEFPTLCKTLLLMSADKGSILECPPGNECDEFPNDELKCDFIPGNDCPSP